MRTDRARSGGEAIHELNNHLTTVLGRAELLSMKLSDPKHRVDLQIILDKLQESVAVVDELHRAVKQDEALPTVDAGKSESRR